MNDGEWYLLDAVDADEALYWSPDVELTTYPVTELWRSNTREDAIAASDAVPRGRRMDAMEWRDRVFIVRHSDNGYESARSPAQFHRLALHRRDVAGTHWLIVRADHPADVGWYLQAKIAGRAITEGRHYPVAVVADCHTWQEAHDGLANLGLV